MTEEQFLKEYNKDEYEKPSVSCDIVAMTIKKTPHENPKERDKVKLQVLMMKREEYPEKGKWSLIGGFLGMTETLEETVLRKMKEKTGIEAAYAEQVYTFSEVERDPRMRIIGTTYLTLMNKKDVNHSLINKEGLDWFNLTLEKLSDNEFDENGDKDEKYVMTLEGERTEKVMNLEILQRSKKKGKSVSLEVEVLNDELAFDHAEMIFTTLMRLRNKLFYTDIAFNLLPEEFTKTTLQDVYEEVLGQKYHKSAFRKRMDPYVEETGNVIQEGDYRPSKAFRYNFKM